MIKESLLNVLMHVFENYLGDDIRIHQPDDVAQKMIKDGFNQYEINQAIDWFASIAELQETKMGYYQSSKSTSFRVYDGYEKHKFTLEAIQFIHWLEKSEIIDPYLREIIIHHAIALDEPIIDMPEIKWVSLMVLFGHPGKQTQLALLEDMILFDTNTRAH